MQTLDVGNFGTDYANRAFVAYFGHLMHYDAAYYGYAWADAIAADMATPERMGYVSTGEVRFLRSCVAIYRDHLIRKPTMTSGQKLDLLDEIVQQHIQY